MQDARSHLLGGLIAGAIIIVLLAAYVVGFFTMSRVGTATNGAHTVRFHIFQSKWQAELFRPAAKVESLLDGRDFDTAYKSD
jgi:hypothetical protein